MAVHRTGVTIGAHDLSMESMVKVRSVGHSDVEEAARREVARCAEQSAAAANLCARKRFINTR